MEYLLQIQALIWLILRKWNLAEKFKLVEDKLLGKAGSVVLNVSKTKIQFYSLILLRLSYYYQKKRFRCYLFSVRQEKKNECNY